MKGLKETGHLNASLRHKASLIFNLVKMRDQKSFYCCKKNKKHPNQNEFKLLSTTGALHQVLHYDRFHFHSSRLFPALHNGRLVFLLLESHFSPWVEVSDRSFGLSQVSGGGQNRILQLPHPVWPVPVEDGTADAGLVLF